MPKTSLDQIKETGLNVITIIICADVGQPAFIVTDWHVHPFSNKGIVHWVR